MSVVHSEVSLSVPPTTVSDWLHVMSKSLSTPKANVPQTEETGAAPVSERSCVSREGSRYCQSSNKHHNLFIYFYGHKYTQFPCYTTENAQSHWLCDFIYWRRKRHLLNQSLFQNPIIALQSKTQHACLVYLFTATLH